MRTREAGADEIARVARRIAARAVAGGFFDGIDIPAIERADDYSLFGDDEAEIARELDLARPAAMDFCPVYYRTLALVEQAVCDELRAAVGRGCITVTLEVPQ